MRGNIPSIGNPGRTMKLIQPRPSQYVRMWRRKTGKRLWKLSPVGGQGTCTTKNLDTYHGRLMCFRPSMMTLFFHMLFPSLVQILDKCWTTQCPSSNRSYRTMSPWHLSSASPTVHHSDGTTPSSATNIQLIPSPICIYFMPHHFVTDQLL